MTTKTVTGNQFANWIEPVADLRIRVFREFPYLYDGDVDYERRYLSRYQSSAASVLVLALDGEQLVGASTGLPLQDADSAFQAPFKAKGMDLSSIYYFGESVLLPEFRGSGVGHRFFDERERVAKALGYAVTTFCAVVRSADHPLRPPGYRSHDHFWDKRGYRCRPDLECEYAWLDLGQEQESPKTMRFWLREG
ncbi:MAG: GNAT family N-acetyltransferase [Pseudomonadales bacterium]|nr:GNAT family N-acetyltransferase [Pseudomonadales bacterium]RLU02726.1 MAG: N-acetyltransferase [Ketobacter sp.]